MIFSKEIVFYSAMGLESRAPPLLAFSRGTSGGSARLIKGRFLHSAADGQAKSRVKVSDLNP